MLISSATISFHSLASSGKIMVPKTYGLTHSVERKSELVNHVTSILGGAIHRNHTSTLLRNVILFDQGKDQCSHIEVL